MTVELDDREKAILKLGENRRLAHKAIFQHRHPHESPKFHYDIIDLWANKSIKHALVMAFRGAAKSTLAEEAITLGACYREFHNGIILGETYHRAVERLTAIKHELETNEWIELLFGDLVGPVWTENKIVLTNGVIIQAFGRGQSLRGSKHLDWRPDIAFADDVEDEESCTDEYSIEKTKRWLFSVVKPAMDPSYRIRVNGTPLHPHSVLMQLAEDPEWQKLVVPIEFVDHHSKRRSSWPERFPLETIDRERATFARHGMSTQYAQEYMCKVEDEKTKPFTSALFKIEPIVRTWQGVYVMYDPARSVSKTSASTGKAVWSWMANRLIVWDASASFWQPDELIADLFKVNEEYNPVEIYVEEDGLNQWLMQPIRHEQLKRHTMLPVSPVKAPKGKIDFINALTPFFKAGEIVFAKPLPELTQQLLSFPSGRIDAPNALAYALRLRPGAPVYDGFGIANIADHLPVVPGRRLWLACNATAQHTTAALVQIVDGGLHVVADWVCEGDPGAMLQTIVADAGVSAGRVFSTLAPEHHFREHDNIGLRTAAARIPVDLRPGGSTISGRDKIRHLLGTTRRGFPSFQVSSEAHWTLNALSGGYCYEIQKSGMLSNFTKPGPHRTLMEGIEAMAALMETGVMDNDNERNYAYTDKGFRYLSTLPVEQGERPTKADWGVALSGRGRPHRT